MGQEDQPAPACRGSRKGRLILMPHSHVFCLVHLVFSTSGRQPTIREQMRDRLHALPGRDRPRERDGGDRGRRRSGSRSLAAFFAEYRYHRQGCSIVEIGLLEVDPREFPAITRVFLAAGIWAFSVSISQQEKTVATIHAQAKHHERVSSAEEFRNF